MMMIYESYLLYVVLGDEVRLPHFQNLQEDFNGVVQEVGIVGRGQDHLEVLADLLGGF